MVFDTDCIDVFDFLECLDIEHDGGQPWVRFPCPFHGGVNFNCAMKHETTVFVCHVCKERGNAISFTEKLLEVSPLEARRLLKQRYQPGFIDPDSRSIVSEIERMMNRKKTDFYEQPSLRDDETEQFETSWSAAYHAWLEAYGWGGTDYAFERGFSPRTLEEWEFGYDNWSNRITFAVRDEMGRLVGFKGRAWHEHQQPKYLVLGDRPGSRPHYGWPCYRTGNVVYGLHRACSRDLIVCEGEFNAVALSQAGYAGVAINGSNFSKRQAEIICRAADSVTVFFDTDEAGSDGANAVVDALKDFLPVYLVPDHEGDPADMTDEQIATVLAAKQSWTIAKITGG